MTTSIRREFETFSQLRREAGFDKPYQLQSGLSLAVGILLGGGFPAAAAAVAILAERAYPDMEWSWPASLTDMDA